MLNIDLYIEKNICCTSISDQHISKRCGITRIPPLPPNVAPLRWYLYKYKNWLYNHPGSGLFLLLVT